MIAQKTMVDQKSKMAKKETQERIWYVVDAQDKVLGRLATRVARIINGKNKTNWTPHVDCGDHVVVINAAKVKVTGRKLEQKVYRRHTGYPGGLKEITLGKQLAQKPERVIQAAVQGMVPKGPLGRQMMTKLKVYAGPDHPHTAQKPQAI
jgi:large subunit ribosomal protein L13